ncbi:MAG: hypothetical protein IJV42_01705 [Bacteroidaceae bacterium]|nr:hypothetical protein [Bacteroidaceae bacterium]
MKELLEELKKFLETATPEELERAWNEVEQFKDVGPTVSEFVSAALSFNNPVGILQESKILNNSNPEYTSGFFNPLHHYGKSFVCI